MPLKTVRVPAPFEPPFRAAERSVSSYFESMSVDPTRGTIRIGDERYVLVRAMSLSVHFFEFMKEMYPSFTEGEALEGAGTALFDMAFAIGRSDARAFCAKQGVVDPIAKLSSGPVHFAHTGWAFVDISADSNAVPDEEFLLIYDHPQSFEADSWLVRGGFTTFCTCHMNAGYSSGWCSESFGLELAAREIQCRARGDAACRFVMAPVDRLGARVSEYLARSARAA